MAITAFQLFSAEPLEAAILVDDHFTDPSLPGWAVTTTGGASVLYNYSVSNGILFSDANPVQGHVNSIVVTEGHDKRGFVNFRRDFGQELNDFSASLSLSWDQAIGASPSGATAANAASNYVYLTFYSPQNGIVARIGLYDNWPKGPPSTYALINGATTPFATLSGSLPTMSNGIHSISVNRTDGTIEMTWLDATGQTVMTYSAANSKEIAAIQIEFGLLNYGATGVSTTKFGAATAHHFSMQTIPEGRSAVLLLTGSALLIAGGLRRRRKARMLS